MNCEMKPENGFEKTTLSESQLESVNGGFPSPTLPEWEKFDKEKDKEKTGPFNLSDSSEYAVDFSKDSDPKWQDSPPLNPGTY